MRRKPSVMSRMVALAVTCVTGTLLLSWATAPYPWLTWLCALLMISNAVYLGVCSEYDDEPDSSLHQAGHN